MSRSVLIVDDDSPFGEMIASGLAHRQFQATLAPNAEEALAALVQGGPEMVVADINMPGQNGLELCRRIIARRPDVPVVVITAFGSLETAVGAIRAGAYDFLTKPFDIDELALTLERAAQHRALTEEVRRLRQVVAGNSRFEGIVGDSPAIRRVCERIDAVASSDHTVLVTGETGTGKELVARALHDRSGRRGGPFVAINCAAMTDTLLESELFGHVRGAFTDARDNRAGLVVKAKGGTIFFDEIGEMPAPMQAKLLRVLETRKVRPVGSDVEIGIDTRVVAATNRDIESEVEEGRFRRDLYFRVNVIRVELPPLRARANDVLLLGQHFLSAAACRSGKRVAGLSSSAAERLLSYPWPGNVRELENAIQHAVALTAFETIAVDDLPERIRDHRQSHVVVAGDNPTELLPMHEVERRYILRVLDAVGGNKTLAARVLGFDRRTMYRKLERFAEGERKQSRTGRV